MPFVCVMLQAGEASAAPALAGAALDKLKQAHELIMRAGDSRQTRLAYQLGALMAREQLVAQDPASARRLLQSVAGRAVGHHAGALHTCFACCVLLLMDIPWLRVLWSTDCFADCLDSKLLLCLGFAAQAECIL